jgi:hypothetical protein
MHSYSSDLPFYSRYQFPSLSTFPWSHLSLCIPEIMTVLNICTSKNKKQVFSPEYYRRRRRQLEKGIIQKRHAVSTKNNIDFIKRRWTRYYFLPALVFILANKSQTLCPFRGRSSSIPRWGAERGCDGISGVDTRYFRDQEVQQSARKLEVMVSALSQGCWTKSPCEELPRYQ